MLLSVGLIENYIIPIYIIPGISLFVLILSGHDILNSIVIKYRKDVFIKCLSIFSGILFWFSLPSSFYFSYKIYNSLNHLTESEINIMNNKFFIISLSLILFSISMSSTEKQIKK